MSRIFGTATSPEIILLWFSFIFRRSQYFGNLFVLPFSRTTQTSMRLVYALRTESSHEVIGYEEASIEIFQHSPWKKKPQERRPLCVGNSPGKEIRARGSCSNLRPYVVFRADRIPLQGESFPTELAERPRLITCYKVESCMVASRIVASRIVAFNCTSTYQAPEQQSSSIK